MQFTFLGTSAGEQYPGFWPMMAYQGVTVAYNGLTIDL